MECCRACEEQNNLKIKTVQLFPGLAQECGKLRDIVSSGRGNIKSRINNRRLPWQLPLHHQAKRNAALQKEHRGQRAPLYDSSDSWGRSSMVAACLGANNLRRSESNGGGSAACTGTLSTTSKKTMESLSASVYNDLQPFRRAHRALIRNRMALKSAKSASDGRALRSGREVTCHSASSRRKQTPLNSGLAKITTCASSYAWIFGKPCIRGFERWTMRPIEFKEQLQMALHIHLRPTEAVAVASFFDVKGIGSVHGEYFARWFLQAGVKSRQERLRKQAVQELDEQRMQRERQEAQEARRVAANRAAVEVGFTPQDKAKTIAVLAKVALSYHDQRSGHEAAQRDFACSLHPDDFRDQLLRSFGVRLSDQQFSALFDLMDINRDGCIDGAEFLRFFFGLGNEERAKEHQRHQLNCRARARNLKLEKLPPISPPLGR